MLHTKKSLMQAVKMELERSTGEKVDFKKHCFANNSYGNNTPVYHHEFFKKAVNTTYETLADILEENPECFSNFGGWEYNLEMEVEKLRVSSFKLFIESKIEELLSHQIKPEFKIISAYHDEEIGEEITVELNGQQATFYVQLCGGEFLSQMGCLLCGEDEHPEFKNYFGDIIEAGEDNYRKHVEFLKEDGKWVVVYEGEEKQCSITSSTREVVERKINYDLEQDEYEFRVISVNQGFTQPCDYSSLPDFFVKGFTTEQEAIDFLELSDEQREWDSNH